VASIGEERKMCHIFMGKHGGKRPLRRQRCRWDSVIKMNLGETSWEVVEWIHLGQDRDQL
jgi:hypothetical protein